jgi:hypothetical protein
LGVREPLLGPRVWAQYRGLGCGKRIAPRPDGACSGVREVFEAMDRRAMIREYKDASRPMGVFRVFNTATRSSFVGSSVDLPSMLNRQRFQLEAGSHPNKPLQEDWNSSSPESFVFEVLDTLEQSDDPGHESLDEVRALEDLWVDRMRSAGESLYNRDPVQDG